VIALWLGHESIETTHVYAEADLASKERALTKLAPAGAKIHRFKPNDALMAYLTDAGALPRRMVASYFTDVFCYGIYATRKIVLALALASRLCIHGTVSRPSNSLEGN